MNESEHDAEAPRGGVVPSDTDLSIARRIGAGDRALFALPIHRYNRRLYRLARAALRNDAEAEDALQEAYLSAYRSIGQFRGDSTLSTWLSRLVLNECLARLRKTARRQNVLPVVSDIDMDTLSSADINGPAWVLARSQMRALLERKVDELPQDLRIVFVLRSVEELSVEETATCLGIIEATVRSRHFRARSLLRGSLALEIDVTERDLFDFDGVRCDCIVAAVDSRLAEC